MLILALRQCETLWRAREIASVALSAERERHTENVLHSGGYAEECAFIGAKRNVDPRRRETLVFKNEFKKKKNIFELGIGLLDMSCHYLSLGSIFRLRKFPAYTVI